MKIALAILVLLNIIALLLGVAPFFVSFAQIDHPFEYFEGMERMRNFLFPSLTWLVGIAVANLVFAGVCVFGRRRVAS